MKEGEEFNDKGNNDEANNDKITDSVYATSEINSQENENTLLYYTILDLHKLSHISENYSRRGEIIPQDKLSIIRELIKPQRWAMILYYLKHGAATVWILRYRLNMSTPKAYRWHKLIEETGLVEIKTTISPIGKMKRPASIWGIQDSTEAQVRDARQYHLKLTSPIYRKADKIAKAYLEAGRSPRVSHGELVAYLKEINEPPRMRHDLARMMRDIFSREARALELQHEVQYEVREREVMDLAAQVFDKLPRPHDRLQITPIYNTMNLVGVDPTLKEDVKAAVLSRIQEVEPT